MMTDREETSKRRSEPLPDERTGAPPIEREHETQAGVFEEDERRARDRARWWREPDDA